MKIKADFYMKEVAGLNVVVATGDTAENMNSMINLNETAAFLWRQLESDTTKEELIKKLTQEYDVDYERASTSVDNFIKKLDEIGCISF
ncbi:PqqD family protein [Intestinibacter sp.]|uniref:PqqD family protein n=1 Tax=Intestinibacter sp. TaxID=1965304 RepID=UPI002A91D70C|nr:PqqD family protein [Intestinibacter sp.]MDY5212287.1 PqqD family protein [Intestinibacter sp.]